MSKTKDPVKPGNIYNIALTLAREETLETLHAKTGLKFAWLRKFRAGEIPNPSVNLVERLLVGLGIGKVTLSKR